MCEISVPLRSTQTAQAAAPYSVAEPRHIVARSHCTDHVKRGAFSASGSGVEPGFYLRMYAQRLAKMMRILRKR